MEQHPECLVFKVSQSQLMLWVSTWNPIHPWRRKFKHKSFLKGQLLTQNTLLLNLSAPLAGIFRVELLMQENCRCALRPWPLFSYLKAID